MTKFERRARDVMAYAKVWSDGGTCLGFTPCILGLKMCYEPKAELVRRLLESQSVIKLDTSPEVPAEPVSTTPV